jgi:aspartyl-tRNA(Asn)/glutamyl-tRNA(Gln) amidotransferase subunit C
MEYNLLRRKTMPDEITPELFNHLVQLAALELNHEEGEYLRKEMNNQLRSIRELIAIPINFDLPIRPHGISYSPATSPEIRADEWKPYPDSEKLLAQAPEIEEGYIIVPEIPHKDLE